MKIGVKGRCQDKDGCVNKNCIFAYENGKRKRYTLCSGFIPITLYHNNKSKRLESMEEPDWKLIKSVFDGLFDDKEWEKLFNVNIC